MRIVPAAREDSPYRVTSTVAAGVTTSLVYDLRGRKISMTDADMGTWLYRYNIFGELIWQKDAKNQIVRMTYDSLGRMLTRTEPNDTNTVQETTTWTYDTAPKDSGQWKGKLHTVSAPGGYSESYSYDSLGRPSAMSRVIAGTTYTTSGTYDPFGRPLVSVYPATGIGSGPFATRNVYNAFGFLKEIRNYLTDDNGRPNSALEGKVYWEADSFDVSGRINGEFFGNGLANDRSFSASTGRLQRATIDYGRVTVPPNNAAYFIQDLSYAYDRMGNVKSRIDVSPGIYRTDHFTKTDGSDGYDGLDRLLCHRVVGGATVNVTYDQKGNITNKSDVGAYGYNYTPANRSNVLPHAVSSAGTYASTIQYDANGNQIYLSGGSVGTRNILWTSFNQVRKITEANGKNSEFTFGAGHERVTQVRKNGSSTTDTTIYVGGAYEKVTTTAGNVVEHKHYIMAPTGRIAVLTISTNNGLIQADTVRYFHSDGLGSITVITDEKGTILKRYAYDAWGKQTTLYTNTGSGITNQAPSTRGFTDHEMLSDHGLIHMNGRVYDPTLGRFISADPNIDGVSDAQGYNRYSYVGNNPLGATDPTGFFSLKDVFKIVAVIVASVLTAGAAVWAASALLGQAIGFGAALGAVLGTGSLSLTFTGAIIAGAGAGFGGAFVGSLLNGGSLGDAFKAGLVGALVGGVTAGITHGIGTMAEKFDWKWYEKALVHGTAQGAVTEACGGQFRHGFYSGFFSSAAAGPIHKYAPGGTIGQTLASALVGGTASAIGGGKFANGAVSGAFTYLFNDTQHRKYKRDNHTVEYLADYCNPNEVEQTVLEAVAAARANDKGIDGIQEYFHGGRGTRRRYAFDESTGWLDLKHVAAAYYYSADYCTDLGFMLGTMNEWRQLAAGAIGKTLSFFGSKSERTTILLTEWESANREDDHWSNYVGSMWGSKGQSDNPTAYLQIKTYDDAFKYFDSQ